MTSDVWRARGMYSSAVRSSKVISIRSGTLCHVYSQSSFYTIDDVRLPRIELLDQPQRLRHGPKSRFPLPELTGDRFPLSVNTARVD